MIAGKRTKRKYRVIGKPPCLRATGAQSVEWSRLGRRDSKMNWQAYFASLQTKRSAIGTFVRQAAGFRAFIPAKLEPIKKAGLASEQLRLYPKNQRELAFCEQLLVHLSTSDVVAKIPFPKIASGIQYPSTHHTVAQTANLAVAYDFAFSSLRERPISTNLLLEIHSLLLKGTPRAKYAGALRKHQNWIGGHRGPHSAAHVPPPFHDLEAGMRDLEEFLSPDCPLPASIQATLAFGQFELLHPFFNANGRLGRLLFLLVLATRGMSIAPRLPMESVLRHHRDRYLFECTYLQWRADWNPWIAFILQMLSSCIRSVTDVVPR